ncbi:hypothetical protein STEG23_024264 [Scotinomys teguina]
MSREQQCREAILQKISTPCIFQVVQSCSSAFAEGQAQIISFHGVLLPNEEESGALLLFSSSQPGPAKDIATRSVSLSRAGTMSLSMEIRECTGCQEYHSLCLHHLPSGTNAYLLSWLVTHFSIQSY